MTFFYLTNFSYVKTVLTIWSVSQFAIFKNRHVFADPITYIYTRTPTRLHYPARLRARVNLYALFYLCTLYTQSKEVCLEFTHEYFMYWCALT